jgi:hypothetical protein
MIARSSILVASARPNQKPLRLFWRSIGDCRYESEIISDAGRAHRAGHSYCLLLKNGLARCERIACRECEPQKVAPFTPHRRQRLRDIPPTYSGPPQSQMMPYVTGVTLMRPISSYQKHVK